MVGEQSSYRHLEDEMKKKAFCAWGSIFSLGILVLMGLSLGVAVRAQWQTGADAKTFSAVGTVVRKMEAETPLGPKGQPATYLYVEFKTDDKTTFVIPFRHADVEAIPSSRPAEPEHTETSGGGYYICDGNSGCRQKVGPVRTEQFPAKAAYDAHGILRYHLCQGWQYCFDSFTETSK